MGLSETQILSALVVALFPAVMAVMLGTALSNT
jgi:photosystem I reaction center subunit XII